MPKSPKKPIRRDRGRRELPHDAEEDRGHDEAIEADRATARRSDRYDARDGIDPSDSLPHDPDSLSGAAGRRRSS